MSSKLTPALIGLTLLLLAGCGGTPTPLLAPSATPRLTPILPISTPTLTITTTPAITSTPTITPTPTSTPTPTPVGGGGWIAFASLRQGNWDLYALEVASGQPREISISQGQERRLTSHPASDRAPAWSPDGTRIAFQSRRDGNWDIYVLDLTSGQLSRLTHDLAYDGAPAWSPDGTRIAFESYRAGDLDIYIMDADGSNPVNLTEDEPAGDCDPAWSPDGARIAFTSWRDGNKEIYVMDADGSHLQNLTRHPANDESPAWSPDGRRIAFVSQREGPPRLYLLDADGAFPPRSLPYLELDRSPSWSPDGRSIVFASRHISDEQSLYVLVLSNVEGVDTITGALIPLTRGPALDETPVWSRESPSRVVRAEGEETSPLFVEVTTPAPKDLGPPYGFVRLPGVEALIPKLSDRVDDSFNALRARVAEETGYDFLAHLSEALRPIDFLSEDSEYLSWHKAGRAIDLLWDFYDGTQPLLEVVREDIGEEPYWRLFLRCARQDGSQGAPLKVNPWDLSYRARWIETQGQGGMPKPIPYGYYVDVTDLARAYGWRRISSYEEDDFDWRTNFLALEYWHYQKTDGLTWYQAMREVYPEEELKRYFAWEDLVDLGLSESFLVAKGIPGPPLVSQRDRALPR